MFNAKQLLKYGNFVDRWSRFWEGLESSITMTTVEEKPELIHITLTVRKWDDDVPMRTDKKLTLSDILNCANEKHMADRVAGEMNKQWQSI